MLIEHFLHVIRGASDEYGADAAKELARIIKKAQVEYGLTFAGMVARLIQTEGKANGW